MVEREFTFKAADGTGIFCRKWIPDLKVKGIVQISHGMAETSERYIRFAEELNKNGYAVYANDHRGHGKTAKSLEDVGYLGEDGFNWMVKDMHQLNEIIKGENPSEKIYLFGHSMGSLLSQMYISLYGNTIDGAILSGTSGRQGVMLDLGIFLSKLEIKKIGQRGKSSRMNNLTFGSYNNAFKPKRTEFDWLSRDENEVDKYVNNPYCGGVFSAQFFYDFLRGIKETQKKSSIIRIPKDLPIFFISGEKDPVGKCCITVKTLINEYIGVGIKDVTYKFYKEGRHELLNEINRDEVAKDIINWLGEHNK